ncbi:neuromusculin isoform 5-T5 [Glossina fuscipes fuscipes]
MSPHYQRDTLIGFILLIYSLVACSTVLAVDQVISEQEGKTVIVPCPVNREKCGELHSLNWFKGDNRIAAMLLDDSNVTSVAAEFEDRVSVEQNPFRLIIRNLRISDEDIYLCDTTYFIPIETCDNFNGHRVELNVLVPPTEVVILDEKGDRIDNGSIVGPIQERQILKSTCIVRNTRPQPQVGWWRGNKRLTTHSPSYDEQNGLFTATLELSLQLSRDDLGHNIECRVDSAAIPNTLKNQFSVDLQVRPTSITINGVEHHTVQGSKVVLTCDIHGARPPVNLTWYNNTQPISSEDNDISEIRTKAFGKEDGTYHTQSELIFNATRFENDMVFRCEAENIVLQINREKPFTSSMTLEVLYPPVVKVSPLDITVNTSDTVLLNCEYVANPASLTHVVWYRNGDMVNVNDTERYEGGNSENVALVIRSTDKQDIGNYSCQLSNVIGKGISEQQTDLDVQFVPIVEVLMIPEGPVKESDESNVTLFCNILDANPSILSKVRWYANSTLLKELPDCEETREDLCHIDPSKLLLESIGRGFFYNYSCEGYNAAGWGTRSDDKELLVHYEPGPAVVTHFPLIAVKKKSVTFSCSVDDPGYPESNRYRWLRGGRGPLQDVVTKDWTVEPVGLDSRTNYSCYAFNEGGKGVMATVNLEVHAPPFFIKNLPPYTGMLHTSRNANLTCRIECVPRCEISWLKDGVPIDKNDTRYFVKDKYMDASPATGDFESMLSVLHFNMSNWPNKKFDIEGDNANYTCVSTGNTVGPGIKSATYFSIEYAPDNTTVSEEVVYVQEETIPGRVICKSRANPEPTYEWLHNNKTVIRGNALIINTSMMRNDTGRYTCAAFNKHGRNTAETFIDVQYKPRCEIERREIDDRDTLICTAYGNPEEADFSWSIKAENESVEWLGSGDNKASKDKSFYILTEDYAIARTYRCVANNTAGAGQFCEVEVAAGSAFYIWWREQLAWWQRWDKTTLIILVASILVLLLAVIIICCIIICICRRRRRQDKYRTDASMSANHSVLSYQPSAAQVVPGINTGGGASMATTILPDSLKVPIIPTAVIISKPVAGQEQHQRYQQSYQIIATPPITQIATLARSLLNVTKEQEPEQTEIVFSSSNSDNNNANNNNNNSNNNNENTLAQTQLHTQPQQQTQPHNTSLESTSISNMKTHVATPTTTTPILSIRRNTNQAPKSPPRWPLRPGVMVHVRNDTKENLAVNRMTLKPNALLLPKLTAQGSITDSSFSSSALNASINTTQTTLLNGTQDSNLVDRRALNHDQQGNLIAIKKQQQHRVVAQQHIKNDKNEKYQNTLILPINYAINHSTDDNSMTPTALKNETLRLTEQNPELEIRQLEAVSASNSAPIAERPIKPVKQTNYQRLRNLIANIFFKRSHPCNDDGIRDSQRSHVGLLGGKFWRKPEAGDKSPFAKEHRLKGIRSSGSVTYKKCAKRTTATTTTYSTCTVSATHHHNIANEFENNNINNNDSIISTKALTPVKVTAQLAPLTMQHQRPLPASAILIEPSLNISHPRLQNVTPGINNNNNVTNNNNTTTTVIQSIPSTIMSSRENRSNTMRNTNSNANNQKSTLKGILKSPTPPPRPAPPLLKRSVSHITTIQRHIEQVQTVQEKSSSMADPLTEPGEYENLPFHGLQTAPNKPLSALNFDDELIYADLESQHYGPIDYKAASIYAQMKKNKQTGAVQELKQ